jgi:hypothetical protein
VSDLSNYLENALVNHVLRNTALTSPTTVYVALFTAVTDAEAGTGTEVSGGSYARQSVAFDAPSNGATQNTAVITFPTATANWGTVTHAGIFDASTAGNALTIIKALAASKVVNTGDIFRFPIGDIDFALA